MVKPLTYSEQIHHTYFEPDFKYAVYFATSKFDKVVKRNARGRITQAMPDLPKCRGDTATFRKAMKAFAINNSGSKDLYMLDNDPTTTDTTKVIMDIKIQCLKNPERKYLYFYVFAGHGINRGSK